MLSARAPGHRDTIGGLAVLVVVGLLAGTLAAVLPARRAARMDALGALAYE